MPEIDADVVEKLKADIVAPLKLYEEHTKYTTLGSVKKRYGLPVEEVNPNYSSARIAVYTANLEDSRMYFCASSNVAALSH